MEKRWCNCCGLCENGGKESGWSSGGGGRSVRWVSWGVVRATDGAVEVKVGEEVATVWWAGGGLLPESCRCGRRTYGEITRERGKGKGGEAVETC